MLSPDQEQRRIRIGLAESISALVHLAVTACLQFGQGVSVLLIDNVERRGIPQALDLAIEKLYEHPALSIALLGCALVCTLPVITFVVVAASSLILTFFGFILIEGVILIAAFLFFIPCFIGIVLFMVAVGIGLTIVYVTSLFLPRVLYSSAKLAPRVHQVPTDPEE